MWRAAEDITASPEKPCVLWGQYSGDYWQDADNDGWGCWNRMCKEPDCEEMVECPDCETTYAHHACVGFDPAVDEKSMLCDDCWDKAKKNDRQAKKVATFVHIFLSAYQTRNMYAPCDRLMKASQRPKNRW